MTQTDDTGAAARRPLTVAAQAQLDLAFSDMRQSKKLKAEVEALRERARQLKHEADRLAARSSERLGTAVDRQDDPGLYDEALAKLDAITADAAPGNVSTYETGLENGPHERAEPPPPPEPPVKTADQAVSIMRLARDGAEPIPADKVGVSRAYLEGLLDGTRLFPAAPDFQEVDGLGTVHEVMVFDDQKWVVVLAHNPTEQTTWELHPVHPPEEWGDCTPRTWKQIWEQRGNVAPEDIPLKGLLVRDSMGVEWVCGFDEERIVLVTDKGQPGPGPRTFDEMPASGKRGLRAWYHQHAKEHGAPPLTEHRLDTIAGLPQHLRPLMLDPNVNDYGVFERGVKSYAVHTIPKKYGSATVSAAEDLEGKWWAGGSYNVNAGSFAGHAGSPAIRASGTRYESLSAALDQELLEYHNSLQRVGQPGNKAEIKARGAMRQGLRDFRQQMKEKIQEFRAGTWRPPEPPPEIDVPDVAGDTGEKPVLNEPTGPRTIATHKKQSAKAWYSVFRETLRAMGAPRQDPGLKHPDVVALYNRYVEDDLRPADAARLFAGGAGKGVDVHKDLGKCSLGSWVGGLKQCLKSKAMKERVRYDPKTKTAAPEVMNLWAAGVHVKEAAKQLEAQWKQK